MKALKYEWDDDIWLLHVEVNNMTQNKRTLVYSRVIENGNNGGESKIFVKPGESYRFILSRNYLQERSLDIRFDNKLLLKIFRLYDRAYLPSSSDMVYSNKDIQ
ncbi:MAG: hypothetical protein KJ957_03345 [Candidatus Omnitrophica bacterium]|nr:hypothetical protein [Candidatus Omnitrophota bacterium]MBU1853063.1 hypothetical protein [Candidatus Omnitrophota bacterium]